MQQLEPGMKKLTGSKLEKEYLKAIYCSPDYLTHMQSISCKMLDWMNHKLESILWGEISITSAMMMIPPLLAESKEELKSLLMKVKEERAGLKFNFEKTKIMGSGLITSWQKVETVTDCLFLSSKITVDGDCSPQIKRSLLLGRKSMANLDSLLKSRDFADKGPCYGFSSCHAWM